MCHLCTNATNFVQHIPFSLCPPKTASTGHDAGCVVAGACYSLDQMSGGKERRPPNIKKPRIWFIRSGRITDYAMGTLQKTVIFL